jgi:AbrB family looped-hinge helix DNA binding protein
MPAMKTIVDAAGRMVISKEIRREAGLKPGMPLEVHWREGRIEIEPAPLSVKLGRRGRFLVAVPQRKTVLSLTIEIVERTRKVLQRERFFHS